MVLFTRNVKKIKGTVHKNGNVHGMCKLVFKINMQNKASAFVVIKTTPASCFTFYFPKYFSNYVN